MSTTNEYPGVDQQKTDHTARFTTGIASSGRIVVGAGWGCYYNWHIPTSAIDQWF